MIAAILAWVFGLALVGLIVVGLVAGRKRRQAVKAGLFTVGVDDPGLAQRTESTRGHLQAIHNGQQLGPGGP